MAEVNEAKREKTQVEDINRNLYDFRYEEKDAYKVDAGLTPAIVEQISREKNDPDWMLELRLKSLEIYNKTGIPAVSYTHLPSSSLMRSAVITLASTPIPIPRMIPAIPGRVSVEPLNTVK